MKSACGAGVLALLLAGCSDAATSSRGTPPSAAGGSSTGGAPAGGQSGQAGSTSGTPGSGGGSSSGGSDVGTGGSGSGGQAGAPSNGVPMHRSLKALPAVRQEHAVVALAGEVYVIGGFTPSATATCAAYNPATDEWRPIQDFPAILHHANAAAVGEKIYVAGFHLGSTLTDGDARVFEYDPNLDDWAPKTAMASERGASCVAVLDDIIYYFGGAGATTVDTSSAYDPIADAWDDLPPLPESREHCVAAGIAGKVYIAAGRSGTIEGFRPMTLAYDPVTRMYEEREPIPTPRGGVAGAVLGGRLFVFGGEGNEANQPDRIFPNVEAYDPSSDSWQAYPDMLVPRHGFGAAVSNDRIYLPGGATARGFGPVDDHTEVYLE